MKDPQDNSSERDTTPDPTESVRELFEKLTDLSPQERQTFLDALSVSDPAKSRELISLFSFDSAEESVLKSLFEQRVQPFLHGTRVDPDGLNTLLSELMLQKGGAFESLDGRTVSHFEIIGPIGCGGMGIVYEARDIRLDRRVALKFLSPLLFANDRARQQLEQEARSASQLDHPNVATIYEVGETEAGQIFIAMAYYEGGTLANRIRKEALAPETVLNIGLQITAGLARAHDQGILHRDVKPGNIMFGEDGTAKLLDFGLAKWAGEKETDSASGSATGTVAYMSPEQARGEAANQCSDVWSLGITLYEMATGERPFSDNSSQATIDSLLDPRPVSEKTLRKHTDPQLTEIIIRCLSKDPRDRFQSASEVLSAIERYKKKKLSISKTGRFSFITAITALVATLVIVFFHSPEKSGQLHPVESLIVLPFANMSASLEDDQAIAEFCELIGAEFSRSGPIRILSSSPQSVYRGISVIPWRLVDLLDSETFIRGSVEIRSNKLYVTASLVATVSHRKLWERSYESTATEEGFREIAASIAKLVSQDSAPILTFREKSGIQNIISENQAALEAFLQGEVEWGLEYSENRNRAIALFERAIELDPQFALAYARLASSFYHQVFFAGYSREEMEAKTMSILEKALAYDGELSEIYETIAWVEYSKENYTAAVTNFERAIEYKPDNAGAYLGKGVYQLWFGRDPAAALELFRKALTLEPSRLHHRREMATALMVLGRFDEARDQLLYILAKDPSDVRSYVGLAELVRSNPAESIKLLRRAHSLDPNYPTVVMDIGATYWINLGDKETALHWLDRGVELFPDSVYTPVFKGFAHKLRGNLEAAVAELRQALPSNFKGNAMRAHSTILLETGRPEEALRLYLNPDEPKTAGFDIQRDTWEATWVAYLLKECGRSEEAEEMIERAWSKRETQSRRGYHDAQYLDTAIFLLRGDKRQALAALRVWLESGGIRSDLETDTLFTDLREEPEFLDILATVKSKVATQRALLQKWEENGELAPTPKVPGPSFK